MTDVIGFFGLLVPASAGCIRRARPGFPAGLLAQRGPGPVIGLPTGIVGSVIGLGSGPVLGPLAGLVAGPVIGSLAGLVAGPVIGRLVGSLIGFVAGRVMRAVAA